MMHIARTAAAAAVITSRTVATVAKQTNAATLLSGSSRTLCSVPSFSFWGKGESDKKKSKRPAKPTQEELDDIEWHKQEDLKDIKRKEENKKIREREAEKKLPNTIEELLKINTTVAQKKICNIFNDLDKQRARAKAVYQAENDEKLAALGISAEWHEKATEVKKSLERAIEDTEQMRLRLEKEKDLMKVFAITKFANEMLEVSDIIEKAMEANKDYADKGNDLYEGTLMTQKILDKILERNGVVKLNPEGEKFDPNFHDALCKVPDETKEPGTVAFVAQTGYMIHERVLRPAKVGVAIKP